MTLLSVNSVDKRISVSCNDNLEEILWPNYSLIYYCQQNNTINNNFKLFYTINITVPSEKKKL